MRIWGNCFLLLRVTICLLIFGIIGYVLIGLTGVYGLHDRSNIPQGMCRLSIHERLTRTDNPGFLFMPEPSPQHRRYLRSLIEQKAALVSPVRPPQVPVRRLYKETTAK